MTVKLSDAVRNAMLDAYETAIGASAKLLIYTGTPPATLGAAATGTLLATLNLPADWMAAASAGSKAKQGAWQATATGSGDAGYYRILSSSNVAHEQGTVGIVGDTENPGDLLINNTNIASGQTIVVSTFTKNAGNP